MSIATAQKFFDAVESGKGWDEVSKYVTDGATFYCQSDILKDVKTIKQYHDWKAEGFKAMTACSYKIVAKGVSENNKAVFYSQFFAAPGAPATDYVYVLDMTADGKVSGMIKIWHSNFAYSMGMGGDKDTNALMVEGALNYFDAIESGKGWEEVSKYVADGATFYCQSDVLKDVKTIKQYHDWKAEGFKVMTQCSYKIRAKGNPCGCNKVVIYSQFFAAPGAPATDYVYVLDMTAEGKVSGQVKVWNSTFAYSMGMEEDKNVRESRSKAAQTFFDAVESGKGWEECSKYVTDGATFCCQSDILKDVKTLKQYHDWKAEGFKVMTQCSYKIVAKVEHVNNKVVFYSQFFAMPGAPPTDYVYVLDMTTDGKCAGIVKIWNSTFAYSQGQ